MSLFLDKGQRVAVHCHAGLGRTGLAIAACLVYRNQYNAPDAIAIVRKNRPGALQTRGQEQFVYTFERHVQHLRCHFVPSEPVRRTGIAGILRNRTPNRMVSPGSDQDIYNSAGTSSHAGSSSQDEGASTKLKLAPERIAANKLLASIKKEPIGEQIAVPVAAASSSALASLSQKGSSDSQIDAYSNSRKVSLYHACYEKHDSLSSLAAKIRILQIR